MCGYSYVFIIQITFILIKTILWDSTCSPSPQCQQFVVFFFSHYHLSQSPNNLIFSFLKFVPLLIFRTLWSSGSLSIILRAHSLAFCFSCFSFCSLKDRVPKVLSQAPSILIQIIEGFIFIIWFGNKNITLLEKSQKIDIHKNHHLYNSSHKRQCNDFRMNMAI